jgi:hypothetical protein
MRSVVIVTARKLDKNARLITNCPCVVPWRQKHDLVLTKIFLRTIVHNHAKRSRKDEGDMRQLAAFGTCIFF